MILVSIIIEVSYNVLNRKYFDNFSFINFIYVIKVYFILSEHKKSGVVISY